MFMGGLTAMATLAAPPAVSLSTWALSPVAIHAWAETAAPGAELIYACDHRLGANSPAGELVRRLRKAGLVTMAQRGRPGEVKAYVVKRLAAPIVRTAKARQPVLDGDMARLLRVIRRMVRAGEVCPPNRALAKQSGVANPSYALRKLVAAKVITSEIIHPAEGTRVITIVATGEATAMPGRDKA